MQKYHDIVLDNAGNAVLGATITVSDNADGGLSTIYSDNAGTALTNPFTASAIDGAYSFYAADGRYNITITATGFDTESLTDIWLSGGNFANKAAAQALKLTANDANRVIHITSDDGGKFVVRYNATLGTYADNGGSYCGTQFIPTGGDGTIGLVRDDVTSINVKWFGAVGDGVTVNTTSIQASLAIGAAYLPKGTFVSGTLTPANAVVISGDGDESILKLADNTNSHLILGGANNLTVKNLKLDGNRANNTGTGVSVIRSIGYDNITIENCTIQDGVYHGVTLKNGSNLKVINNKFIDNVVINCYVHAAAANVKNVIITDNIVDCLSLGIAQTDGGIKVHGDSTGTYSTKDLVISNNIVEFLVSASAPANQVCIEYLDEIYNASITGNTTRGGNIGISGRDYWGVSVTGNTVDQPKSIGVEVANNAVNTAVSGNHISGSDSGGTTNTKGIAVTTSAGGSTKNATITGNNIKDSFLPIQLSAAAAGEVENVSISGNSLTMSSTSGRIDIGLASEISVTNNHIDLNGQTTATGIKADNCDKFNISNNLVVGSISGATGILISGSSVDISYGIAKNNGIEGAGTGFTITGYKRYTGDTGQDITGTLEISNNVGQLPPTRASGDGNPSAALSDYMYLSGASAITDLIHGYAGKEIIIRSTGTPTITNGTPIRLNGSVNFVMASGDILVLKSFTSGVWEEVSRMVR